MGTAASNRNSVRNRFRSFDLGNRHSVVFSARKGVRAKVFYDFAETIKMPEKKLAQIINLSARTISNYRETEKLLEPLYSEHLLKLLSLYNAGEEIFGNIDEFNLWLNKPFWNSDEKPVDWLSTPGGVDLVMEEIEKLAQGYPV